MRGWRGWVTPVTALVVIGECAIWGGNWLAVIACLLFLLLLAARDLAILVRDLLDAYRVEVAAQLAADREADSEQWRPKCQDDLFHGDPDPFGDDPARLAEEARMDAEAEQVRKSGRFEGQS